MDDGVEKPVFQQKLRRLKSLGKFLADGLLDHARPGEADQRAGLGNVDVAQHGEARGDAAGGGVGQNGNERQANFVKAGERGGNFCELHQADRALHHARAAGTGNDHQRQLFGDGHFHSAGHFLAHHGAHRAADKCELHRATNDRTPAEQAFRRDDGVGFAQFAARFFQARGVGPRVRKFQRVTRRERGVVLHPARIEQQFQALRRAQPEMVLALRADAPVGIQIFLPHNRPAVFTLGPQPFRLHAARVGRRGLVDSLFFPLKPSHRGRVLNPFASTQC